MKFWIFCLSFFALLTVAPLNLPAQNLTKTLPTLKLSDPLPANLFVELAKAINPAVVNISTSVISKGRRAQQDPMLEMLEQFYGRPNPDYNEPGKPQRMGLGTGFIIREDGLIVTNNHVIQNADLVEVQLSEGSDIRYKAIVIGSDERTDLALIKIEPKEKLTVASLGSSKDVEVGEWVAAFGNPYGHGHSMTKGIISSKGRAISEINKIPLLQTDASINPGNSGGPLVNSKGQVIGVNAAIDARAQGIGFAIPIDEVKAIIPQLELRGGIRKGYLGINPGDIDEAAANYLNLPETRGSVILGMNEGPGKKGGLKIYDIITDVDNKKIKNSRDLVDTVADLEPGKKVKLKIIRNEKPKVIEVVIGERPSERPRPAQAAQAPKSYNGQKAPFNLGFTVADITAEIRTEWNVAAEVQQPIVIETDRGALASRQGLRVGDLIVEINKVEIKTAKDVLKALKKGKNIVKIARPSGMSIIEIDAK